MIADATVSAAAEIERLTQTAAHTAVPGGMDVAGLETAIREGMLSIGAGLLEQLLSADHGHRGPRIGCACGRTAAFVGYRMKTVSTVLGNIRLSRAYYHCRPCRSGMVPLDTELGLVGVSLTPGLRTMIARAGTDLPFANPMAPRQLNASHITLPHGRW